MRNLIRRSPGGERGFTLIELLVVVAVLGVLAAVAIPNVGKFIGQGAEEAARAELHNLETAAMAAMADSSGNIAQGAAAGTTPPTANFGDSDLAGTMLELVVDDAATPPVLLSDYIAGGLDSVSGAYVVLVDGTVAQVRYPGVNEP